jgi:hypothetical protein
MPGHLPGTVHASSPWQSTSIVSEADGPCPQGGWEVVVQALWKECGL